MDKGVREDLLMWGAVIALIGLRFLFCCIAGGIFYLLEPHLGLVVSAIIALIVGGLLITMTGTWQHQIERKERGNA